MVQNKIEKQNKKQVLTSNSQCMGYCDEEFSSSMFVLIADPLWCIVDIHIDKFGHNCSQV